MKLLAGLAVAASLATSAAAAAAEAPVFLLRSASTAPSSSSASSSSSLTLPRQIARQILLQRLNANDGTSFFNTLPRSYDPEAALDLIQQFGGKTAALFEADGSAAPKRQPEMMIVVEGAKAEHIAAVEAALPEARARPAFAVADPPSQSANARLFVDELIREGIAARKDADVTEFLVPQAWARGVFVGLYDVKRDTAMVDALIKALPQLVALAEAGDADVTLVLLPEASRNARASEWAEAASLPSKMKINPPKVHKAPAHGSDNVELRIRDAESESVIVEDVENTNSDSFVGAGDFKTHEVVAAAVAAAAPAVSIPACFQSFNSCVSQTANCTGHGTCVDKFAVNNGGISSAKKGSGGAIESCFVCHCFSTLNRPEDQPGGLSTTQWAGNMCQKVDVSIPFWLITGFSVTLVGAVAFAIGLLFSVGEEKLPGVIGAGVSRAK